VIVAIIRIIDPVTRAGAHGDWRGEKCGDHEWRNELMTNAHKSDPKMV
jgi:hypothetical protein